MINLNISNARDKLYNLASSCIKYNDVVNISTKEGNVVLLSEDDYRSLIESLYLAGVKGVYEDIEEAVKTPTPEFSKNAPLKQSIQNSPVTYSHHLRKWGFLAKIC